MFELKHFISFFLSPLVMVFVLAALGLYYVNKRHYKKEKIYKKRGRLFFIASFMWLFFISYQPVATSLFLSLENQYAKLKTIPEKAEYILALGGDSRGRSYEVLRLYQQNKKLKIVASGYKSKRNGGAEYTANLLIESGVNPASIITKPEPRDTKEEVLMMKEIAGDKPFILVTAAYHMPRAIALFKKAGLNPIAAPTRFSDAPIDFTEMMSISSMQHVNVALHEYIGMLWYKIRGDI